MKLKQDSSYELPPEGAHNAICVDVIELGKEVTTLYGEKEKIRIVWELPEVLMEDGRPFTVSKKFTASLHQNSTLNPFLGKWRGKPLVDGEEVETNKLIGACGLLLVTHSPKADGSGNYASIDACTKPQKRVQPSGKYDPVAARKRIAEAKAKQAANQPRPAPAAPARTAPPAPAPAPAAAVAGSVKADDDVPF